jgi:hypothetical protein
MSLERRMGFVDGFQNLKIKWLMLVWLRLFGEFEKK